MKKKIFSLCLFVIMLLVLCFPNYVYAFGGTTISNSSSSVSLDNPNINIIINDVITALTENMDCYGLTASDFENILVKGPYPVYYIENGNGDITINKYDLHVYFNNKFKGVLTIIPDGNDFSAQYSESYSNDIIVAEGFMLFEDENGLYCNNANSMAVLDNYTIDSDIAIPNVASAVSMITLQGLNNVNSKTFEANVNSLTRASVSVPLVTCYGTLSQSTCYDACIASTVRYREPSLYPNLTAEDVRDAANEIDMYYAEPPNDPAYGILDMMEELYLGSGHYNIVLDESISISSFKGLIDNDRIVIATLFNPAGSFTHSVIMCGYTLRSSGGVIVNNMEPASGSFTLVTWASGTYEYSFGTSVLTQEQAVVSYY